MHHADLLPRCYHRTDQPHLHPYHESSVLLFLLGLGCLRWVSEIPQVASRSCAMTDWSLHRQKMELIQLHKDERPNSYLTRLRTVSTENGFCNPDRAPRSLAVVKRFPDSESPVIAMTFTLKKLLVSSEINSNPPISGI